jgi:hypothetical protein
MVIRPTMMPDANCRSILSITFYRLWNKYVCLEKQQFFQMLRMAVALYTFGEVGS